MHKKMEENEGMTFVCDECGNVFKTKLSLKNHIRSQHKVGHIFVSATTLQLLYPYNKVTGCLSFCLSVFLFGCYEGSR